MNRLLPAAAAAISLLLLQACDREPQPSEQATALLRLVPAGSPYLAANLEPIPAEVVDAYLKRAQPVLERLQAELSESRSRLEGGMDSTDPGQRLLLAVLQEFDGKLSRQGMESLGLDLGAHKVVYGIGAFPVLRLGLADAGALRAAIERTLQRAGIDAQPVTFQDQPYWRMPAGETEGLPLGIYVAVLADHLVAGLLPTAGEAEFLPALLGLSPPAQSDAAQRLQDINRQYDYTGLGTGVIDFRLLGEEFFDPASSLSRMLAENEAEPAAAISTECQAEFREIISHVPRMVLGTTELSIAAAAYQYVLETDDVSAKQLAGLVSALPIASPESTDLLAFSFGLKPGAVRDFLRSRAEAIVQKPYACDHLAELNRNAAEGLAQLSKPMPPFVNNLKGLSVSVKSLDLSGMDPASARGLLVLHAEQPEMFVGVAQMFLPELAELKLTPGEPPVAVPAGLVPVPGLVSYVAMNSGAIGFSIGAGEEAGLLAFLARKGSDDGSFLSASYDTGAYLELSQGMGADLLTGGDAAGDPAANDVAEFAAVAQKAWAAVADRTDVRLRFGKHGFVADSRVSFKP